MDALAATRHRFASWLEHSLDAEPPPTIVAFVVNLYDQPFRAELIGSTSYDPADPDWACKEAWAPKERSFDFPSELAAMPWQARLELCKSLVLDCRAAQTRAGSSLRGAAAVAVGFVDGELEIVGETG